ncbi:MAG: hypothetical protein LBN12_02565 [Clostridiales Family XIII bacterium]|jgi:DNA-binding transcriptional regulator LsrR (DeoR family)|nr:hypothetical protein [Clostridiales Family XIII bacterium]
MLETDERYYKKLKAAYLVYKSNMTQQEAATILNISRPTLIKMLNEAIDEGIVTVQIRDVRNAESLADIETKLIAKFKIRDAIVVDCSSENDKEEIIANIGAAAAKYFESLLKSKMTIGISWGSTIEAFISNLKENKNITDLKVVTLVGGMLYIESKYHANILAQRMLEKYDGRGYFLYAPTFASSKEEYKVWMQNKELRDILEMGKKVDIAFVGIGASLMGYSELNKLLQNIKISQYDKVGGINAQFLDIDGQLILDPNYKHDGKHSDEEHIKEINSLFIGVRLDDLKKNKFVVALAGGAEKHFAIRAAILGGYVSVLVTDKYTAQFLLEPD